jgi:hypothetical protein
MVDAAAIERLPKWAQNEISRLRVDLESTQAKLATAIGEAPSNIKVNPYHHPEDDKPRAYLPDSETVRYELGNGEIDVRLRDGMLEIQAMANPRIELTVRPRAANTLWIGFDTATYAKKEKS